MTPDPRAIAAELIRAQSAHLDSDSAAAFMRELGHLADNVLARQVADLIDTAVVTVSWPGQEAASAEQQHLIEIDAGSGYKFRATCTCGHVSQWFFGPVRAVAAGQAHVAGVGAVAEAEQLRTEIDQLRTQVNTTRQALADEIRERQACEAERDQARERVDALARELADFIPARSRLDDSLRAITRPDLGLDTDGQTIWLSHWIDDRTCAGSPITAIEPGDSWLDIVAAVAAHTCEVASAMQASAPPPAQTQPVKTDHPCATCGHDADDHHKLRCEAEACADCSGWTCVEHKLVLCGCTYAGGPTPQEVKA